MKDFNSDLRSQMRNLSTTLRAQSHIETFSSNRKAMIRSHGVNQIENSAIFSELFSSNLSRLKSAKIPREILTSLKSIHKSLISTDSSGRVPFQEFLRSGLLEPILFFAQQSSDIPETEKQMISIESLTIVGFLATCHPESLVVLLNRGLYDIIGSKLISNELSSSTFTLLLKLIANVLCSDPNYLQRLLETEEIHLIFAISKQHLLSEEASTTLIELIQIIVNISQNLPEEIEREVISFATFLFKTRTSLDSTKMLVSLIKKFAEKHTKTNGRLNFVHSLNLETELIKIIGKNDNFTSFSSLQILFYLSQGDQEVTSEIVIPEFVKLLSDLLSSSSNEVVELTLGIISNLVKSNRSNHENLFEESIICKILYLISQSENTPLSEISIMVMRSYLVFISEVRMIYLLNRVDIISLLLTQLGRQNVSTQFKANCLLFLRDLLLFENENGFDWVRSSFHLSSQLRNLVEISTLDHSEVTSLKAEILVLLSA